MSNLITDDDLTQLAMKYALLISDPERSKDPMGTMIRSQGMYKVLVSNLGVTGAADRIKQAEELLRIVSA